MMIATKFFSLYGFVLSTEPRLKILLCGLTSGIPFAISSLNEKII